MQSIFGSLFTTATAVALGWLLTRRLDVPLAIRFAAGAAILHLIVFGLMLAGQARSPILALIGVVAVLLAAHRQVANLWRRRFRLRAVSERFLIAVFAVVYIVNALAPETQADPNAYHLTPAIHASKSGGFVPEISFYERLPHATELLFVFAYAFGGVSAAKLLHLTFLFWTLPLIVALGRKLDMPDPLPAIAAAMYFVTPVVGVTASSAFNDAALVFYVVATVWTLFEWRDNPATALALLVGVLAGMCYAIKMSGGITIAAAGVFILAMRQWRALLPFSIGVAVLTLPWLLRNSLDTGNPFAPFFNVLFPNRYFYSGPEQKLRETLRTYGVPFAQRFWEVAAGSRLQGIVGPLFLLAPLTLIALSRSSVRWLWLFAIVFSAGWWMNAGARFLLPSLPFLALALVAAFPRPMIIALLIAHAVLSWPWLIPTYSPRAWRLGLESRVSWDHRLAQVVQDNTQPDSRIFNIAEVKQALLDRKMIGSWQSAEGYRFLMALELARLSPGNTLDQWRADFEARPVTAVRLRQQSPRVSNWSLNEILLYHAGKRLPNRRLWQLDANTNRWDTPLAFDGYSTSRWSTWQGSKAGDFFLIDFGGRELLDSVRATSPAYESDARPAIELRDPDGTWTTLKSARDTTPTGRLRLEAVQLLARAGVTHIAVTSSPEGVGVLGQSLVDQAEDWGLDVVTNFESVYLLRIRQTP